MSLAPGRDHLRLVLYRRSGVDRPDAVFRMQSVDTAIPRRTLASNKLTHLHGSVAPDGAPAWLFDGGGPVCARIEEVCDGLDNHCSLIVDEGAPCPPGLACGTRQVRTRPVGLLTAFLLSRYRPGGGAVSGGAQSSRWAPMAVRSDRMP